MDVFPEARTCFSQVALPPGFSQLGGERAKECLLRCVLEEAAASSSAASDFADAQRALQVSRPEAKHSNNTTCKSNIRLARHFLSRLLCALYLAA